MIGFSRFFRRKTREITTTVTDMDEYGLDAYGHRPDGRCYAPHCDPSILHAPRVCKYCDEYSEWQQYRQVAHINFTGENDPDKAPCPSEHFRPAEVRDRWGGNVPNGSWLPDIWSTWADGGQEPFDVG